MVDDRVALYLLYDDACDVCVQFAAWVGARDSGGKVVALALSGQGMEERFLTVNMAEAREQLTVCDQWGEVVTGLEALRVLARHLPGLERLDWVSGLPGIRRVAGGVYRTVNRYRRRLCLRCGEKWMPSKKYSVQKRREGRRGRS